MNYILKDTAGDVIVVVPLDKEGVTPMVAVQFQADNEDAYMTMHLTDRMVLDLKQAMNRALRESERTG